VGKRLLYCNHALFSLLGYIFILFVSSSSKGDKNAVHRAKLGESLTEVCAQFEDLYPGLSIPHDDIVNMVKSGDAFDKKKAQAFTDAADAKANQVSISCAPVLVTVVIGRHLCQGRTGAATSRGTRKTIAAGDMRRSV
jgi:hypothetical protein